MNRASGSSAAETAGPRRMIAGGAMASATAQGAGFAALGLASIVLGRALGPGGFGTFAVAFSLQAFLAGLASVGLHNGIAYEVAVGRWAPGPALRHALAASIGLGVLVALAAAALLVAFGDDLLPDVSTAAIVLLLAGIPAGVWLLLLVGTATALERYEAAAILQGAQPVGIAVAASIAALALDLNEAVAAIGVAVLVVGAFASVWALRLASRLDAEDVSAPADPRIREAMRFGARTWASDLLSLVNVRGDVILVGAFAGSSDAGFYAVATAITSIGLVAPQALAQVLLPRVASMDKRPRHAQEVADPTIARAGRHMTLIALATAIGLVVAILLVPLVYGSSFGDAVPLGLILIPGVAAFGISRVLAYALAGLGEPGTVLRLTAVVVVPTVVAFLVVIPAAGAVGAAIVSTVSYFLALTVTVVALSRRSGLPPMDLILPRREDLSTYPETYRAVTEYVRSRRGHDTQKADGVPVRSSHRE